jgi:hypothetical protein
MSSPDIDDGSQAPANGIEDGQDRVEISSRLPIEAVEAANISDIILALALVTLAVLTFLWGDGLSGFRFEVWLFTAAMLWMGIHFARRAVRVLHVGPNKLIVSKEGLNLSNETRGTLPWSEVIVLYPKFSHGKIHSIDLKLQSRRYLLKGHDDEIDPKESIFINLDLSFYWQQNALGETIINAANHYCKNRSGWASLPQWMK